MQSKSVSGLSSVVSIGISIFALCIVALHLLRPDLDPIANTTSQYANGEYGWVMTLAFAILSAVTAVLMAALYIGSPSSLQKKIGLALLAVWFVGPLIAAAFPIDPIGAPQTASGRVHAINGGISFLCLTIGITSISLALAKDADWTPRARLLRILALLVVVAWVFGAATVPTGSSLAGLAQRTLLVLVVIWYAIVAKGLRENALVPTSS